MIKTVQVDETLQLKIKLNMVTEEKRKARSRYEQLSRQEDNIRTKIEDLNQKDKDLFITPHAITRFRERIMDLPNQKIKNILSDESLLNKYKENGPGRYKLPEPFTYVTVAVKDFSVITCFNQKDPEERIDLLRAYMDNWVEDRCKQVINPEWNIMALGAFKRKYYR
jgi:hypothetical protein